MPSENTTSVPLDPNADFGNLFLKVESDGVLEPDPLLLEPLDVEFDRIQTTHRVQQSEIGRPGTIANEVYGDPSYWWPIMLHNDIVNPVRELEVGMELEIPSLEEIVEFVNRRNEVTQG